MYSFPVQNRVNVHDSKWQLCKNTGLATGEDKKKPVIGSFFRKSLMAGNLYFWVFSSKRKDADIVSISASLGGGEGGIRIIEHL